LTNALLQQYFYSIPLKEDVMKKSLTIIVAALALVSFSGAAFAAKKKAEEFPTQEATVTTTVTNAEGKVVKEDAVSDTTKGADTTSEYKQLQKMKEGEAGMKEEGAKAEKKPAVHKKKKAAKKSAKKAKTEPAAKEAAPAPAETPEAK
jgi:hypothetical protein